MKTPATVLLVVGLCLIVLAVFCGLTAIRAEAIPTVYRYDGKALMSEVEYTSFKEIVACENVTIFEMSVYSSENPLVVFDVAVPADVAFNWGVRWVYAEDYVMDSWKLWGLWIVCIGGGIVGVVLTGVSGVVILL